MFRSALMIIALFSVSCFPYVYHDQSRVLLEGVDLHSTLEIARVELDKGGFGATLPIWAIRDQIVSEENARVVAELYFKYIDRISTEKDKTTAEFGVWHFTWAVSNLYRNGNDRVKKELENAYHDAQKRPARLTAFRDVASEHVNGTKIYMGDIHAFARSFAQSHIVVPGNKKYLQSLDEYKKNKGNNSASH